MRWKQSLTSISIAEKFHNSRQIESYEVKICYKLCGVASLLKAQGAIFIASTTLPQSKLLVRHNDLHAMLLHVFVLPTFNQYVQQTW